MSKLMDKLKKESARLKENAEKRGNFEKVDWFKPEKGDNLIRILPNLKNEEDFPFVQARLHFITVEKKDGTEATISVRCLKDFEEDCPVCNEYEKVVKKDKNKASAFRAVERYIYNVIDYKNKSVHPYAAGVTIHEQIMGFAEDFSDNMFSLESGRDWKLVKKVDPRKGSKFGVSYALRPALKDTALPPKLRPLLEGAIDLTTLYKENERAKMLEFLGHDVADESEPEDEEAVDVAAEFDEEEAPKKSAKPASKPAAKKEAAPEFDADEELPDFGDDEEEAKPAPAAAKAKAAAAAAAAKAKAKPAAKAKDEDEDLEDIDTDDSELDEELRELGVM